MLNEVQSFWVGLRMSVMARQQGMTWESVGRMNIVEFFHALRVSEKNSGATDHGERKLSRQQKRTAKPA